MTSNDDNQVWLRILQINDVYELKNFPHLKTLIDEHKQGPDKTLVFLTGDFLGPSLLSSLDKGRGMVDVMNACGITHVCFGNHETDVPMPDLAQRVLDSHFEWINTNMRELDAILDIDTLPHQIVEISNKDTTKKIGLLGLLTEDPSVYRPDVFGGATIEPIVETTQTYMNEVMDSLNLDLVIPMTHQRMNKDREFCSIFGKTFPIVIGGHDHEPYDETIQGSRVVKTGMEAENTAIIDIIWKNNVNEPEIKVDIVPTKTYCPDPDIRRRVRCHERILQELEAAKIFRLDQWIPADSEEVFSTHDNRLGPSTGSQVLCTMLRMGMRSHCCIMNAGNIRAGKVYPKDQEWFAWSDLKAEIPFSSEMTALHMPGRVLEDAINNSRRKAREDPPESSGGYLQHCDKMDFDEENRKIVKIQGEVFDPDRLYLVALPAKFFSGIDNHVPLLEWAAENKLTVEEGNGMPAKVVIVETFAALLWLKMGSFETIDKDGDGILTRDEVRSRAMEIFGDDVADLVVDSVFGVADLNNTGVITPVDMAVVQFVASDMLDHIATGEELAAMRMVASEVLGKRPSHIDVRKVVGELKNVLDMDKDGKIRREEAMKAIGEVRRRSLLI